MISTQPNRPMRLIRITSGILITGVALALGWAIWTLPHNPEGLRGAIQAEMPHSGVGNPVTAVLLNFRGYDTLLEVGVLLIALLGVWSLRSGLKPEGPVRSEAPGPVLTAFARLLVPVMMLIAAYLTWVGADAPGGAFQGAAVLGAVGVLLLLIQPHGTLHLPVWASRWRMRGLAGVGFAIFLGVALIGLPTEGRLLDYPSNLTGSLILIIELALTVSIAVILIALFPGGPHPESPSVNRQLGRKDAP